MHFPVSVGLTIKMMVKPKMAKTVIVQQFYTSVSFLVHIIYDTFSIVYLIVKLLH